MSNYQTAAAKRRQDIVTQPIAQQLTKLTFPMLLALVAIMGLGLVDSYFISYLGTPQLAAIGFISPVTYVASSIALGLGMAISSLTSRLVGAKKMNKAARLITDGFYLTAIVSLLTIILFASNINRIFITMGATPDTLIYIKEYMFYWLISLPFMMLTQVSSSTFRALGDTSTAAIIAISMTLSNIVLDPLFIFGIGPFPRMEMQGAALATLLSVAFSMLIGFYHLGIKENYLLAKLPEKSVFAHNLRELSTIAVPAVISNTLIPLSSALLTMFVASYGVAAVAGYGVGSRIEAVSYLVVFAMSSTLPMFIGQNLGANKPLRAYQAIKLCFKFTFILQLIIYVLLLIVAQPLAEQFSDEEEVQKTITLFLYIVPISYSLGGIVTLTNVSMNVLRKPKLALTINFIRLFIFYLPFAWIGSTTDGLRGLFVGIALGNLGAYFLALLFLNKVLEEQKIKP